MSLDRIANAYSKSSKDCTVQTASMVANDQYRFINKSLELFYRIFINEGWLLIEGCSQIALANTIFTHEWRDFQIDWEWQSIEANWERIQILFLIENEPSLVVSSSMRLNCVYLFIICQPNQEFPWKLISAVPLDLFLRRIRYKEKSCLNIFLKISFFFILLICFIKCM